MEPVDHLICNASLVWCLIMRYFENRMAIFALGAALILLALLIINRTD